MNEAKRNEESDLTEPLTGSFKHPCTCGGYAWQMSGRPESDPHMDYCPRKYEHIQWYQAKQRAI